jgi:acyl-CoA synthetase (AMP-forming)/AMP-acid ligase II
MLIHHFLEKSAEKFPDKIALVHGDLRATYARVNSQANALARYLLKRGICRGDRVVMLLENSLEYVVGYYGVLKTGAVIVPVITDLKADGLGSLLRKIEPRFVISSFKFGKQIQALAWKDFGVREILLKGTTAKAVPGEAAFSSLDDLFTAAESEDIDLSLDDNALASIIHTSGSTGGPKGVMLSHRNVVVNTQSICRYLELSRKDIQMVVLPFFYVMGKSLLNTHFAVGGTVVINNRFAFPVTVLEEMVKEGVTGFSGVPSTYAYLLHRSPLIKYREKLGSLRYCSQAGGHMARAVKEALRQALPEHTKIFIMYGATEASARLSYLEPDRFQEKMDSVGRAIPGGTLGIVDETGNEMPPGQAGELVARGENIMLGYWGEPEATGQALRNGWYHTGDQAYRDEEGYFYVTGREDQLLKVGGHRVNPQEIEDILMASERLLEVVVVGRPDEFLGNRLIALAVPKNANVDRNGLLALCAEKLPKFKIPADIIFTQALPKNLNGKIDRTKSSALVRAGFNPETKGPGKGCKPQCTKHSGRNKN